MSNSLMNWFLLSILFVSHQAFSQQQMSAQSKAGRLKQQLGQQKNQALSQGQQTNQLTNQTSTQSQKLEPSDSIYIVSPPAYQEMLKSGVNRQALVQSLQYLQKNSKQFRNKNYLTVIDYNKPSDQDRFYLFDLRSGKYEIHLVAHGQGSGEKVATLFSNRDKSRMTSLGYYRTAEIYKGKHGRSLRLDGLSRTNSIARDRTIVIHGASSNIKANKNGRWINVPYVSKEAAKQMGRVGRSHGCPALDSRVVQKVIDRIKEGSLIFAFHDRILEKKSAVKK